MQGIRAARYLSTSLDNVPGALARLCFRTPRFGARRRSPATRPMGPDWSGGVGFEPTGHLSAASGFQDRADTSISRGFVSSAPVAGPRCPLDASTSSARPARLQAPAPGSGSPRSSGGWPGARGSRSSARWGQPPAAPDRSAARTADRSASMASTGPTSPITQPPSHCSGYGELNFRPRRGASRSSGHVLDDQDRRLVFDDAV